MGKSTQRRQTQMTKELFFAIKIDNKERVREILSKNPDQLNLSDNNSKKLTPLWKAMMEGREEIVEVLVKEFGADPNEKRSDQDPSYNGYTFLQYAASCKFSQYNYKIAELLIRLGAEVNMPSMLDHEDGSPIWLALLNNNLRFYELFLQNGAKLDFTFHNKHGDNLLHIYAEFSPNFDEDAVRTILDAGVLLHELNIYPKSSPFHKAISKSKTDLVSFFIKQGADVNQKCFNVYPLFLAVFEHPENLDLINLLISNGTEIDAKTDFGNTALHQACLHKDEKLIGFLIHKGADVCLKDNEGNSAFLFVAGKYEQIMHEGYTCYKEPDFEPCVPVLKQIAKLVFDKQSVLKEDLDLIQKYHHDIEEYFEECKVELSKMARSVFYLSYSYFSILKMNRNIKKLAVLTKNEEFVAAFEKNLTSFSCYKQDLQRIFQEAIKLRNETVVVYNRLHSVLKNLFPKIVVKKLADNLIIQDLPLK